MSETSPRHALPFILPGQAQKELFHNEALVRIDAALNPAVEGAPRTDPPADPEEGQCWIAAAGASGAWEGLDHSLAMWTDGGWRHVVPQTGMRVWSKADGVPLHWDGAEWGSGEIACTAIVVAGQQVVGSRQPGVPSPSGGTVIDVEARAAINALIEALMSHGLIA